MERLYETLSIFVDESGNFGKLDNNSPYYLVTLVFHDQSDNLSVSLKNLGEVLSYLDYKYDYIHTRPLIRCEYPYFNMTIDERRQLLYKMLSFYNHAPIRHSTLIINKKSVNDTLALGAKISKQLKALVESNLDYFNSFDKIIVYYDNGQLELNSILNSAMNVMFSNIEFRKPSPAEYRLLQTADFICSIKLLEIKNNEKRLSKSEQAFFYKPQELQRDFFKMIKNKEL